MVSVKLAVLNLTGKLSAEMETYFSDRHITLIDPLQSATGLAWTHILTKDVHDFDLIRSTYLTVENDIKIISLTPVNDVQNFVLANGKFVFDELWLKNEIGFFILDKFFQEYGGINLGDNYPTFSELGSFNVINPFNTGEYLDRIVHSAFQEGVNALSIKTSFDHLLMYLTGLKNKGKVGLPLEVTYGKFNEVFGVQLNFFTQDLMLEDVTSSLSSNIKKKAEEYLFNISIQSTDFFDFTFLSEVNKAVITLLWTKDERIKFENKGLMFTNLSAASQITGFHTVGVTSTLIDETVVEDYSEKINLPQTTAPEEMSRISGEYFSDSLAEKISSSMDFEKIKQIVSGDLGVDNFEELIAGLNEIEEAPQVIRGGVDEEDVKIIIPSQDSMEELIQIVKGKVEEEKSVFKVSGGKFDIDNFAYRVTAGLSEKIKGDEILKVKVLSQDLPETIKHGLFDFAAKLDKEIDQLNEGDLDNFSSYELPKLLQRHAEVDESRSLSVLTKKGQVQARSFLEDFKVTFQNVLKEEFVEDSVEGVLTSIKSRTDESKVKSILKDTLKKSLEDKFHLSEKKSISQDEQEVLVKALTSSLSEEEDKIRSILTSQKNQSIEQEVTPMFKEPAVVEVQTSEEDKALKDENALLKNKLKVLMGELKTLKDTQTKVAQIDKNAKDAANTQDVEATDPDKELREQFSKDLVEKKFVNEQDAVKLASLLERETKLISEMREQEIKLKRQQIESSQKEIFFSQEIEKTNRLLKSKDLVITKAKETLSKITERKDHDIRDLQQKLEQVNLAHSSSQQQNHLKVIRDLERENANMSKMVEVYRNKVSSLASSIGRQSTKGDDTKIKDELRKLQTVNNQLQNIADASKKEATRYKDKSEQESALIAMLKNDKQRLEQQLKQLSSASTSDNSPTLASSSSDQELKKVEYQVQQLEVQLKEAIQRCKDYEAKIGEMQRAQRLGSSSEESGKVKVTQLENSVKKLTQDLVDSRNQLSEMKKETNKLRQEKTALQNQFDKFRKDIEKSKAAAPKKTNGRAA